MLHLNFYENNDLHEQYENALVKTKFLERY